MKHRNEFIERVREVLAAFGPIDARRMFGGHGIYHDGLIFGLIAGDVFYLKTDAQSQAELEAAGCVPFQFEKNGKTTRTSYFSAPAGVFDEPDEAKRWASMAYAAALRSQRAKTQPRTASKKTVVASRGKLRAS